MSNNGQKTMTIVQEPLSVQVYDFSDEFNSENIDCGIFNGYPFIVTVIELSNDKYVRLQKEFLGTFHLPDGESSMKEQLANKQVDPAAFNDNRALSAVASWTLKQKDGTDIPVCMPAWKALPRRITELIEKGIAKLNPTLEADFQGDGESAKN